MSNNIIQYYVSVAHLGTSHFNLWHNFELAFSIIVVVLFLICCYCLVFNFSHKGLLSCLVACLLNLLNR